ncbi:Single-strand binding protein family protein [Ruminococcus sp. YE71]|uniref:single-stranded DNA-binding protein n=1 Tax=unclassified Ruminococcus TaxID=2608920 RepID=UPI00088A4696|nr:MULTISPECIES: single-stranded DNA-binding protein [unclassified Ruminococcus]SDA32412.1 Single-strand binding protein family protein [Ruminococcus sp. YE78]SFW53475.1 Single-strand binding protein family protein [Ruminococcus sp. YE71]
MLNKIMMTGRITTDLNVVSDDNYSYCKFDIEVDQPKHNYTETVETDTFTCLAFDDNAKSVNFLYSKGGQITFVSSLRNAPDKTAVIIVEELHLQNRFTVKVDVDSGQLF